jgi:hypothetical protein
MGRIRFVRARGSPSSRTLLSRTACPIAPIACHPSVITYQPSAVITYQPSAARTGGRRSGPAAAGGVARTATRGASVAGARGAAWLSGRRAHQGNRSRTYCHISQCFRGRADWPRLLAGRVGVLARAGVVFAWSRHHDGANAVKRVRLESPCRRHPSAADLVRTGARGLRDRKLGRGKSKPPARRSGSAFRNGRT